MKITNIYYEKKYYWYEKMLDEDEWVTNYRIKETLNLKASAINSLLKNHLHVTKHYFLRGWIKDRRLDVWNGAEEPWKYLIRNNLCMCTTTSWKVTIQCCTFIMRCQSIFLKMRMRGLSNKLSDLNFSWAK